jgi:hypothetical protein
MLLKLTAIHAVCVLDYWCRAFDRVLRCLHFVSAGARARRGSSSVPLVDEDDWETEADRLVAGVNLHDVDESKFEGEADAPVEDDWENDVPATQVRYSSCQLNTAGRLQH